MTKECSKEQLLRALEDPSPTAFLELTLRHVSKQDPLNLSHVVSGFNRSTTPRLCSALLHLTTRTLDKVLQLIAVRDTTASQHTTPSTANASTAASANVPAHASANVSAHASANGSANVSANVSGTAAAVASAAGAAAAAAGTAAGEAAAAGSVSGASSQSESEDEARAVLRGILTITRLLLSESFSGSGSAVTPPADLLTVCQSIHNVLIDLSGFDPVAQEAAARVFESWWQSDLRGKDTLIAQTLPYLLARSLELSRPVDVRRVYAMRDAFSQLEFSHAESIAGTRGLLLRCLFAPVYLKTTEGRRFLSFFLLLDLQLLKESILIIRNQIPSGRKSLLEAYGEVFFRTWRSAEPGPSLLEIEYGFLQGLIEAAVFARTPELGAAVRRVVGGFSNQMLQRGVDELLLRVSEPIIFRSLQAANPAVRRNALLLLAELFPLRDPAQGREANESLLNRQLSLLFDRLLMDPCPAVRASAAEVAGRVLCVFWEVIPSSVATSALTRMVDELAADVASPAVRMAAVRAVGHLLQGNPVCHELLRGMLPRMAAGLRDRSRGVRVAVAELLITVASNTSIRLKEVISLGQLIQALEEPNDPIVSRHVTRILLPTYLPTHLPPVAAAGRFITLMQRSLPAAAAFARCSFQEGAGLEAVIEAVRAVVDLLVIVTDGGEGGEGRGEVRGEGRGEEKKEGRGGGGKGCKRKGKRRRGRAGEGEEGADGTVTCGEGGKVRGGEAASGEGGSKDEKECSKEEEKDREVMYRVVLGFVQGVMVEGGGGGGGGGGKGSGCKAGNRGECESSDAAAAMADTLDAPALKRLLLSARTASQRAAVLRIAALLPPVSVEELADVCREGLLRVGRKREEGNHEGVNKAFAEISDNLAGVRMGEAMEWMEGRREERREVEGVVVLTRAWGGLGQLVDALEVSLAAGVEREVERRERRGNGKEGKGGGSDTIEEGEGRGGEEKEEEEEKEVEEILLSDDEDEEGGEEGEEGEGGEEEELTGAREEAEVEEVEEVVKEEEVEEVEVEVEEFEDGETREEEGEEKMMVGEEALRRGNRRVTRSMGGGKEASRQSTESPSVAKDGTGKRGLLEGGGGKGKLGKRQQEKIGRGNKVPGRKRGAAGVREVYNEDAAEGSDSDQSELASEAAATVMPPCVVAYRLEILLGQSEARAELLRMPGVPGRLLGLLRTAVDAQLAGMSDVANATPAAGPGSDGCTRTDSDAAVKDDRAADEHDLEVKEAEWVQGAALRVYVKLLVLMWSERQQEEEELGRRAQKQGRQVDDKGCSSLSELSDHLLELISTVHAMLALISQAHQTPGESRPSKASRAAIWAVAPSFLSTLTAVLAASYTSLLLPMLKCKREAERGEPHALVLGCCGLALALLRRQAESVREGGEGGAAAGREGGAMVWMAVLSAVACCKRVLTAAGTAAGVVAATVTGQQEGNGEEVRCLQGEVDAASALLKGSLGGIEAEGGAGDGECKNEGGFGARNAVGGKDNEAGDVEEGDAGDASGEEGAGVADGLEGGCEGRGKGGLAKHGPGVDKRKAGRMVLKEVAARENEGRIDPALWKIAQKVLG
ncbi:unnamed protein product [Closterium sp. NIES-64]|nr:unnamed protein product [Closterium sp. NIES-64]